MFNHCAVRLSVWRISCLSCPGQTRCVRDVLVSGSFGDPNFFYKFDGSAHHDHQIGRAGAGLFEISSHGLQLLYWAAWLFRPVKTTLLQR